MNMRRGFQKRHRWCQRGSVLVEVSIALGAATLLALLMMKASLLAITGNDWTTMQTLTDAMLTRETALANRTPFAAITSATSLWPEVNAAGTGSMPAPQTIQLGRIMGGTAVNATLTRFRVQQPSTDPDVDLAVWRLHSVLQYTVAGKQYAKSSSTLRAQ